VGVELNHTIVRVRDKRESAQFLAEILSLRIRHFLEIITRPHGSGS
jgi:hypothetical protein